MGVTENFGQYSDGEIPNIKGTVDPVTSQSNGFGSATGAFTYTKDGQDNYTGGSWNLQWGKLSIDASRSSSVYKNVTHVLPKHGRAMYIIKY